MGSVLCMILKTKPIKEPERWMDKNIETKIETITNFRNFQIWKDKNRWVNGTVLWGVIFDKNVYFFVVGM